MGLGLPAARCGSKPRFIATSSTLRQLNNTISNNRIMQAPVITQWAERLCGVCDRVWALLADSQWLPGAKCTAAADLSRRRRLQRKACVAGSLGTLVGADLVFLAGRHTLDYFRKSLLVPPEISVAMSVRPGTAGAIGDETSPCTVGGPGSCRSARRDERQDSRIGPTAVPGYGSPAPTTGPCPD